MEKDQKLKVHLRNGFADRMGIKKENTEIQLLELDDRTRIALSNAIDLLWSTYKETLDSNRVKHLLYNILCDVYVQQVSYDDIVFIPEKYVLLAIHETIQSDTYDAIFTVIEYLVQQLSKAAPGRAIDPHKLLNDIFEKEYVGYRFISGLITPISDQTEIASIEDAVNSPYKQVNEHLLKAQKLLSDRDNPDYENSIKESISAVECVCSIIIGKETTLGNALDKLRKSGLPIHPSLLSAFDKLYGYTSNGTAIRHAGQIDGPHSTFEEAKFMLVSCCAFVNYLIGAMSKYNV